MPDPYQDCYQKIAINIAYPSGKILVSIVAELSHNGKSNVMTSIFCLPQTVLVKWKTWMEIQSNAFPDSQTFKNMVRIYGPVHFVMIRQRNGRIQLRLRKAVVELFCPRCVPLPKAPKIRSQEFRVVGDEIFSI